MTLLLTVLVFLIWVCALVNSKGDVSSPSVLITSGFLISVFVYVAFSSSWGSDVTINTVLVKMCIRDSQYDKRDANALLAFRVAPLALADQHFLVLGGRLLGKELGRVGSPFRWLTRRLLGGLGGGGSASRRTRGRRRSVSRSVGHLLKLQ